MEILKLLFVLIFIWTFILQSCSIVEAQSGTKFRPKLVKKYKRPNNLPKANSRINCPICASDFMQKRVTIDDPCFNPRFNLTTAELELISECPLATRECTTETVYVNGVLTSIKRKCGQSSACSNYCVVAGLGLTTKTCTVCCPAFEYDTYTTEFPKKSECAWVVQFKRKQNKITQHINHHHIWSFVCLSVCLSAYIIAN